MAPTGSLASASSGQPCSAFPSWPDLAHTPSPKPPTWVGSLDVYPPVAHGFYGVIAFAMALGLGLDYARLDAVKMLFWAAKVNGALAPPLLVLVVLLTSRADVMGEHRSGTLLRSLAWACVFVMLLATIIMFVTAYAG
jgi:Mn2+/Fe2+ NRAMP family transporter